MKCVEILFTLRASMKWQPLKNCHFKKKLCVFPDTDPILLGYVPFSVAEPFRRADVDKGSFWTVFGLNGTDPRFVPLESVLFSQLVFGKMAALKVC